MALDPILINVASFALMKGTLEGDFIPISFEYGTLNWSFKTTKHMEIIDGSLIASILHNVVRC